MELERPEATEDLYLARGDEVDPYRPVMQGDVYAGVTIAGVELEYEYAMVIEHPCTMRRGAEIKPRLQMHPVTTYAEVPLETWGRAHLRVFPLPRLDPGRPDVHFAAAFGEIGMVSSAALDTDARVACLSEVGILFLQQRQIFNMARTKVETSTLRESEVHIFEEVELHEDWNRALVPLRVRDGGTVAAALLAEAVEFDTFLQSGAEEGGGESLRRRLSLEFHRASVRRQVRQEIAARVEGRSDS